MLAALGLDALPAAWTAIPLAGGGFVAQARRSGLDVVVPARARRGLCASKLVAAGARPAGVWAYEAHRVAALRPRLGVDTDERTIPHEVGWIGGPGEGAVHLNKGCYRGQETVARVHNLGKPPRMLVLLHLDGVVGPPRHRRSRASRRASRSDASAPSSTTSTSDPSPWHCSSGACPPTPS